VDLADPVTTERAFAEARPDVILHAAAMARIVDCYRNPTRARTVNTEASALLARLAAESGARLVYVSTDLVFDGERGNYREGDEVNPLSVYATTKQEAETAVLTHQRNAVVRLSLLFGPSLLGLTSFFDEQVAALRAGRPVTLFVDEWRTPLSQAVAADCLVALALSDYSGVLHLGGPERLSRVEMGLRLADRLGADPGHVVAVPCEQAPAPEPRPRDTSLDSSRWRQLYPDHPWPDYDDSLRQLLLS
jgi:dTDP-4-dehydrorhamnose reductase